MSGTAGIDSALPLTLTLTFSRYAKMSFHSPSFDMSNLRLLHGLSADSQKPEIELGCQYRNGGQWCNGRKRLSSLRASDEPPTR
jgi:hypothetical protein